jgi:peptidoglycan/xylan/chitin deacetylase (PgdA/CDA1 family)
MIAKCASILILIALRSRVNLPVQATNDNPFITSHGTLIDDFEHTNLWVLGKGSKSNDTIHYINGTMSLKLTSSNNIVAFVTKTVSLNLSEAKNFVFWFYVDDVTQLREIALLISSSPTFAKYYGRTITVGSGGIQQGWNCFSILPGDFNNNGGESWNNPMIRIRFKCLAPAEKTASVSFDSFYYNMVAKAQVFITFDDGYSDNYDNAYPILSGNGQAATMFVVAGKVENPNRVNLTQLTALFNAGWSISSHTVNHVSLTSLSKAALDLELNGSIQWLETNGFGSTASYIAFPYGDFNDTVISYIQKTFRMARCSLSGTYEGPLDFNHGRQFTMRILSVSNTVSVEKVKIRIDRAINQGSYVVLLFHHIVNSQADESTEYLTSNFKEISDYLKTKEAMGLLNVTTFNEYFEVFHPPTTHNPTIPNHEPETEFKEFWSQLSKAIVELARRIWNYSFNSIKTEEEK